MSKIADVVRRSNYMVTLNCNISYRQELIDPEFSRKYRRVMEYIARELEYKVEEREFQVRHKDHEDVDVSVRSWTFKLERGEKRKFLHVHGVLKFDNYVRVDETKLQAWVQSVLVRRGIREEHGPKGVITSFRYFKDGAEIRKAYVGKQRSLSPDRSKTLTIDAFTFEDLRKRAQSLQLPNRGRKSKAQLWAMLEPHINK